MQTSFRRVFSAADRVEIEGKASPGLFWHPSGVGSASVYDGDFGFFLFLRRGEAAVAFPRVGRDGFPRRGGRRLSLISAAAGSI